jgi:hypothetical protein
MEDLTFDGLLSRGNRNKKVKLVQEWLSLHGFGVVPDRAFGPATEAAVRDFQAVRDLTPSGEVDEETFEALVEPMRFVLQPVAPAATDSVGDTVVAYARRHLSRHPREVGGQNLGPWVRLYMGGREGREFAWCAGFACFVLEQACTAHGVLIPITPSVSCDSLAASAKANGVFLAESATASGVLGPGSLFLSRRTSTDWTHIGIVTDVAQESFRTIEGNTNDEGSNEGFEVCARSRSYRNKDFIRITQRAEATMVDRGGVIAHNAEQLTRMDAEAAGLLQHLFLECDQRGTLIRFSNTTEGGLLADVEVVAGDPAVLARIARLLEITLDGNTLRV